MWLHRQKRVAFVADPRTGSRTVGYEILKNRGFEIMWGHHGVPWGSDFPRNVRGGREGDLYWWFLEPLYEWTFYAAHRNHFEVFHSIAWAALGGKTPTPEKYETYLWKHPALYRNSTMLFPVFFEIAGCRELRFDHLRDDVAAMLANHDLPPLKPDEGRKDKAKHITVAKPRDQHYSEFLTDECRWWIEKQYRAEMEKFGYRWELPGGTGVPPGA
jgi:hypothetical protein